MNKAKLLMVPLIISLRFQIVWFKRGRKSSYKRRIKDSKNHIEYVDSEFGKKKDSLL